MKLKNERINNRINNRIKKSIKNCFMVLAAILVLTSVAVLVYLNIYYKADTFAESSLQSTEQISVTETSDYWVFSPTEAVSSIGYMFYPGGKVEESAYAPLLQALAEKGVTCVLLKLPFRLAVFDINAANTAIDKFPNITDWYVGGHSLGGAMAATYAAENSERLDGLILMGAYTTSDLSSSTLRMLSIYGSEDGVLNRENFEENKKNQPSDTSYYEIAGGNHAYYGNYGEQEGDNPATISQLQQQSATVDCIIAWLNMEQ